MSDNTSILNSHINDSATLNSHINDSAILKGHVNETNHIYEEIIDLPCGLTIYTLLQHPKITNFRFFKYCGLSS